MSTAPVGARATVEIDVRPDLPWVTIVWNDPVNLMSYVTYVFQAVFGYSKEKAEKLMLDVHHKGRAVVPAAPARRWSATCRSCTPTACGRPCSGIMSGSGPVARRATGGVRASGEVGAEWWARSESGFMPDAGAA